MRHVCALCGRGFDLEADLAEHDQLVHRSVPDPVAASIHRFYDDWRVTCTHCKTFVGVFSDGHEASRAALAHLRRCAA